MINPGDIFYPTNRYNDLQTIIFIMHVQNEYEPKWKSCTALEIYMKTREQRIIYLSKAQLNHLYKKLNDT